jgi:hypothetical protein
MSLDSYSLPKNFYRMVNMELKVNNSLLRQSSNLVELFLTGLN